ncbi:hypothetical protein LSH36_527g00004 [Paralvinella palmiformis]|uniref:SET domain-containing protein n=1 Tax=Paralvinella palmiformis TaxID=53620 RepID=A0AAD9MW49_9ANNE|nr:hypothetical protein LSH36_527g00004 [Paralvinella palmiformis]
MNNKIVNYSKASSNNINTNNNGQVFTYRLVPCCLFCIFIVIICRNCSATSVEKAKLTWIRHLKNELLRDRKQNQDGGRGRRAIKGDGVSKKNVALTRGSMLGSVFSGLRWPELHKGGFLPQELECPTSKDRRLTDTGRRIPIGTVERALKTLPKGFTVTWSSIAGAGMGVFATVFIREHTWLAEYEGRLIEWTENLTRTDTKKRLARLNRIMDYDLDIYSCLEQTSRFGMPKYLIDASRESSGNWLRYINMARWQSEQNVVPAQCGDKFFYRTSRPIVPGQELLTNYGRNYMAKLDIDAEMFYKR